MALTVPSLAFNVTWTVATTVFLLTLSLCTLPPEMVVASQKTLLMVGAGIAAPTGWSTISGPISKSPPCSSLDLILDGSSFTGVTTCGSDWGPYCKFSAYVIGVHDIDKIIKDANASEKNLITFLCFICFFIFIIFIHLRMALDSPFFDVPYQFELFTSFITGE